MIGSTSATVALTAFIVIIFILTCRFLELAPFGMPVELQEIPAPAMIAGRL